VDGLLGWGSQQLPVTERVVGRYLRWFLAVVSAACGLVHFAASGEHFDVSWMHGTFFALVGWAQLAWAVGIVVHPDRRVLATGVVLNGATVAVWGVSRTFGMPVGAGSGVAEPVGFTDAMVTAFEVVIVVVCVAVLLRPGLAESRVEPTIARVALGLGTLAIVVVSTTAITPSFASEHAHGGGHGHGEIVIQADGTSKCEQAGISNAGNAANGGHGHRGPVPWQPLDPATRATLAEQLVAAQDLVRRYPTVADAEAAGYRAASTYVPCIAAHYLNTNRSSFDAFDPGQPQMLLFTGNDPDDEIVGISYSMISPGGPPEGFAGPNDVWHAHEKLCMKPGFVLGTETADEEECEARGGVLADTSNDWMMHLWIVPQWANRWGMFASEHPDLGGRMGDMDAPPDPDADDAWFGEAPTSNR
jgi:hypothetical protein